MTFEEQQFIEKQDRYYNLKYKTLSDLLGDEKEVLYDRKALFEQLKNDLENNDIIKLFFTT